MVPALQVAAVLSLGIWLYLLLARGGYWRCDQRLGVPDSAPADWPAVTALVPARNEAPVIARALGSLLAQDYPGRLKVILVDDHSGDGTAEVARAVAQGDPRLKIIPARDLPSGWSGKLWALAEGAEAAGPGAPYLWLSDADIAHQPDVLRRLVAKAEGERLDLVSVMVVLSCRGGWERLLIPPFVLFFQKLYPFAWVKDPKCRTAAAAGGCVLLSAAALERAGGFAAIKGALIDDCALAAAIKHRAAGRIWLGLTRVSHSIRPYQGLAGIWLMVARSAYTQLRRSPWLLLGCVLAMTVTYLVPPLALVLGLLVGPAPLAFAGGMAWMIMTVTALPSVRFYGAAPVFALLLPLAALLYTAMTLDSARRHWTGRGGLWKGRAQGAAVRLEDQAPQG